MWMEQVWRYQHTQKQLQQLSNRKQNADLLLEFEQRMAVLSELGYVDSDRTVQLKGRVAAEVLEYFRIMKWNAGFNAVDKLFC